jgi:polysaccharide biosynthesis/export protein
MVSPRCATKGGSLPSNAGSDCLADSLVNFKISTCLPRAAASPRALLTVSAGAAFLALSACTFLPSAGPSGSRIKSQAARANGAPSYQLVPIDGRVLSALNNLRGSGHLSASGRPSDRLFGRRGLEAFGQAVTQSIAVGDVVSVAIFETDSALFGPSLSSANLAASPITALPPQTVDQTGAVSVPFVGRVKALGRLPSEVEAEIREGLRMKTPDPQVIVTVGERKGGNLVSVTGDVRQPGQIPVPLSGSRVIDAIAAAGGSVSEPYDVMVSITRAGQTRSDPLQEVYDKAAKNVSLRPGDTVVLRKRSLNFLAFGSTGKVGSFPITSEDLSLSAAVAASGGPDDFEANPSTIFVYRQEPLPLLRSLGRTNLMGEGSTTPVVYQLDLTDPEGFFYANNFTVRDRDIVYYAPAGSAGVIKFMRVVNTLLAPAMSGVGVAGSAKVLGTP